jgi:hypothetical protein
MRQAGKGVILEVASQDLKKKIEKILKAEQAARTSVSTYRLMYYFIPKFLLVCIEGWKGFEFFCRFHPPTLRNKSYILILNVE